MILGIDEGHHIGPSGYNLVKTIINNTRAVVAMTAIPELILRINKQSYSEAAQLFTNRLYQHCRFGAPTSAEALDFMQRRKVKFASAKDANEIAKKVADDAAAFGRWRYLDRCARKAKQQGNGPFNMESFAKIISRVKSQINLAMGA